MAERKLTDRQKMFCRLCAEGMKPIEAAKEAGYQNVYRTTGDMLRNERIRKEIERQKDKKEHPMKTEEAPVAKKEEILTFLTGMMREDDDPKLRMKAAELLGKRESLFEKGKTAEERCCVVIVDDLP